MVKLSINKIKLFAFTIAIFLLFITIYLNDDVQYKLYYSDQEEQNSRHSYTTLENTTIANVYRKDTNRFIAHAGGSIEGNKYNNSLDALDSSYKNGFRLFEPELLKRQTTLTLPLMIGSIG
ncbi:hypothetical protein MNBD_GAMMA05-928 [hydrothermal vent metagenome]|uniref:Uncharacterized protein n=1 Tax=hydrothermal vent metagenome TaxID=652676 RepID=A0A3B0WTD6_9ZZZZ